MFGALAIAAQDEPELLKKQIDIAKIPTVEVDLLNNLAQGEINKDSEVARKYANRAASLARKNNYQNGLDIY